MDYEVVIVGAGPAGGHCARRLSEKGYRVLLLEQHSSFLDNNFSSAASPLEILEDFQLPESVVARFWKHIDIIATNVERSWRSDRPLGVVFDFAKLREFLAGEVVRLGGEVRMGCRYLTYEEKEDGLTVSLKSKGKEIETVNTKLVIDATGYARAVIYPHRRERPELCKGVGIEYLIKVSDIVYQKYADSLVFFLGHKWSPKGYGWIFPMEDNRLKVGSAWLEGEHPHIDRVKPLKEYIHAILSEYLRVESYELIETHGSIIEYSIGLQDIYYRGDRVLAIGDTVSTINLLGGEGIRHAMRGAEIACPYIESALRGKADFNAYERALKQYFEPKWSVSDRLSRKVYLEYSDSRIDKGVAALQYLSMPDLIDILFYYKFEKYTKGIGGYLLGKIRQWLARFPLPEKGDRTR
ncbi:NAD(P)/FAD-dependent oxidoreductase [Pannus brasiliensis CCIBt3594]|uniref:NAD(P)/FAD-dependent oxidoreductase n=1 Tax=Pannus brasiliensis CCIBt3594 TaxID=1427578 RepID=A0AAW9R176_9CHRO